ncbi:M23 family metallopeptidase [Streptomyces solicathayae]|uniref:M23 family metallopeptidase n=1 Tax=Streptomyces solicathayae TaxID=3081768 RepID=A0ABZ0LV02_9ACTN|nr:M23 family metallopeptidase [Streptomyces sp. HUAS YS2]WOX22588.1 M23 family metallopeptidase [Streptomyces sp. HUAS YS2]
MNDQHPHAGYVGDDAHMTGSFATDPLFGAMPGGYDAGQSGQYDSTRWTGGGQQWDAPAYDAYVAQQPGAQQYDTTGQWDATAWNQAQAAQQQTGQWDASQFASYDATAQWTGAQHYDTGAYDATAWNYAPDGTAHAEPVVPEQYTPEHDTAPGYGYGYQDGYSTYDAAPEPQAAPQADMTAEFEVLDFATPEPVATDAHDAYADYPAEGHDAYDDYADADGEDASLHSAETMIAPRVELPESRVEARPVRRASGGSRGRRRTPAKRSALLTVAVPSACVMGVAGIAAASVSGLTDADKADDTTSMAAADPSSVKPVAANTELDTQLAALSADARDFGDRASRTQERIDLKARQDAEKKKREEEAARKEALRPKFVLPVKLHQLSARYGQSGVNWMSLHTGIDFPVQYGTPVMAATDGTVRTQWNNAYGNMAIVTTKDGTETWYCHLSSTKIRSGKVKAGDVIAYSGNSGNSTGPHLHFEVRPGGGSAIDPLPWLLQHGLNPVG